MPELPEVEIVVRTLRPHIAACRITGFEVLSPRAASAEIAPLIIGQTIVDVHRHGKYILIDVDRGRLAIHLRMTGKLLVTGPSTHPRAIIHTSGPSVVFDDIRQFGSIQLLAPGTIPPNLGPDFLALTALEFATLLLRRSGSIKPVLLNQSIAAGLGNIYADEALFRAGIHPLTKLAQLSIRRLKRFHAITADMLNESIAAGGSSISDYVDALGARGSFQLRHAVYGRSGQPCPVCSALIRRMIVAQRGTHFCPRCQRVRAIVC